MVHYSILETLSGCNTRPQSEMAPRIWGGRHYVRDNQATRECLEEGCGVMSPIMSYRQ